MRRRKAPQLKQKSSFTSIQMSMSQGPPIITPVHIQQAKAALSDAGIPVAVGNQALDLATAFYHETPQVSQADAMRRERNRIQDELETVSSQLLQERRKTLRLEQELAAARQLPKTHQNKAYKLRKRLRAILAVLQHPEAKETSKLKSIAKLVAGALEGEDDPEQAPLR
jgi:predicted nuclease with TOPRIM domain